MSDITANQPKRERLQSLDALRGFDMFWIVGGAGLLKALAAWTGHDGFIEVASNQTSHSPWIGLTAWDLIFPLFVFMSGITMPYALTSKLEKGTHKRQLILKLGRRVLLLTLFGLSFSIFTFDPEKIRLAGVLQLIAVSYGIAGLVVIYRPLHGQVAWAVGLLVSYWFVLRFFPSWFQTPDHEAGAYSVTGNLPGFLDRQLPGRLYMGVFDPEGSLRVMPGAAMALMGAITGAFLRKRNSPTLKNVAVLVGSGLSLLVVGYLWSFDLPIIKPLWTSTYITVSAGYSLLLLAFFYLVIDVVGWRWLGFIFLPLGMNAITIYMLAHFVSFGYTARKLTGGLAGHMSEGAGKFTLALTIVVLEWLLLYFLYRKRIFLSV